MRERRCEGEGVCPSRAHAPQVPSCRAPALPALCRRVRQTETARRARNAAGCGPRRPGVGERRPGRGRRRCFRRFLDRDRGWRDLSFEISERSDRDVPLRLLGRSFRLGPSGHQEHENVEWHDHFRSGRGRARSQDRGQDLEDRTRRAFVRVRHQCDAGVRQRGRWRARIQPEPRREHARQGERALAAGRRARISVGRGIPGRHQRLFRAGAGVRVFRAKSEEYDSLLSGGKTDSTQYARRHHARAVAAGKRGAKVRRRALR